MTAYTLMGLFSSDFNFKEVYMEDFYIGQIFKNKYPTEAADFCNNSQSSDNPCYIKEIEPLNDVRRFQIVRNEETTESEITQNRIIELESYLSSTDWYAVRYAETSIEIPADIREQRQSAREEISRLREELEINNV